MTGEDEGRAPAAPGSVVDGLRGLHEFRRASSLGHLSLCTTWRSGTPGELAFAVLHCTGGDVLIALSCLLGALLVTGSPGWPRGSFGRVAAIALAVGVHGLQRMAQFRGAQEVDLLRAVAA